MRGFPWGGEGREKEARCEGQRALRGWPKTSPKWQGLKPRVREIEGGERERERGQELQCVGWHGTLQHEKWVSVRGGADKESVSTTYMSSIPPLPRSPPKLTNHKIYLRSQLAMCTKGFPGFNGFCHSDTNSNRLVDKSYGKAMAGKPGTLVPKVFFLNLPFFDALNSEL